MTEVEKLRQWRDEALRLGENLSAASERAELFRREAEMYSKSVEELREENEALNKTLRINECDSKRMLAELEEIERNLRDTTGMKDSISTMIDSLESERNALRKRLESATEFRFEGYFLRRPLGGRWEVVEPGWNCLFCSLPDASTRPPSCYFDTYEEAEAAALKAMEVAG